MSRAGGKKQFRGGFPILLIVLAGLLAVAAFFALLAATASAAATSSPDPEPIELKQKTLDAFEVYVRLTDKRNDDELQTSSPYLWVDGLPDARRQEAYAQLRGGQVRIERLNTLRDGQPIKCPDGLIHHWVGVIFIPGATIEQTLRLIQDYDHHSIYYGPDVARSKLLERRGDVFKVYLRFRRKKVITVVLNTEYEIHYSPVDATHAHSRSFATRIAEVENYDKRDEREKPIGNDGGYLWRMDTWWRFLERDGGTYVQCESVSLTRTIPAGLRWLIGPFVNSIPRETLAATLTATRTALTRKPPSLPPAQ